MKQKLELLAPAGSFETVKAVVSAGADAVYFGGEKFSARAYAGNLNTEEVLSAIDFGHIHGRKMILAVNTLLKEDELYGQLYDYLYPFYERGLDAVIVQDFGAMQFIRKHFEGLSVHTSTQMTVTGAEGARFLVRMGASRIVLAREVSLAEIHHIRQSVPVELESFVHGALCYCYSGQCLFSSLLGGRSGNRGRCAQPCRLPYEVYDVGFKKISRKGQEYPLSLRDLCALGLLPDLAESGISSFKIEGRMKQTEYAAGVVSIYRAYLDRYLNYGRKGYSVSESDQKKLVDLGSRSGFTDGYYKRRNGPEMVTFQEPGHRKDSMGAAIWTECRKKISGSVKIEKDSPAVFTVMFRDVKVSVTGEIPEPAQKHSLTEDALRVLLLKTGNTPFVFEKLDIQLEDGLFLPAAQVNALRRSAVNALLERFLSQFKRNAAFHMPKGREKRKNIPAGSAVLSASVQTKEQLSVLLDRPEAVRLYIDGNLLSGKDPAAELLEIKKIAEEKQKELYYILPPIFRKKTAEFYRPILSRLPVDGFLAGSYDALSFLLEQKVKPERIRLENTLYTWSEEAKEAFLSLGISGDTVPLELNRKEIKNRDNTGSEIVVYGRLPLMVSAQCIRKNIQGCSRKPGVLYLKDRYGIYFPVKNDCRECCTVIYNSKPLNLFLAVEELMAAGIENFRLSFTTETKEETLAALEMYQKRLPVCMEHATYGHYKRGVE